MPVVDAVKKELVKGGKCPSSEFVPERERDRLRSDTASKVTRSRFLSCRLLVRITHGYHCFMIG